MMNKPDQSSLALDTVLVHGDGQSRCANHAGVPTVLPIYTSTTYLHQNAESLEQAFSDHSPSGEQVYVYAQQGNPNAHALESALAQVEGGVGAVTFGSSMAAIHAALLAAGLAPGTKILVAQDLYGATIGLLRNVFLPLGVEVILRDLCSPDAANFIRTEQPDVIYSAWSCREQAWLALLLGTGDTRRPAPDQRSLRINHLVCRIRGSILPVHPGFLSLTLARLPQFSSRVPESVSRRTVARCRASSSTAAAVSRPRF